MTNTSGFSHEISLLTDVGCDELVLFPTSGEVEQLKRLVDVIG